jgi:DNA replication protein DnaC
MITTAAPAVPDPGEADKLKESLVDLNLTVAARRLDELIRKAQDANRSYSEFLASIVSTESTGRFERKLARSLKRSHLSSVKSLEEFDFSIRRKLSPAAVKELLNCRWIEEGRSVICVGRSGTGKTHIAKALGHAACTKE